MTVMAMLLITGTPTAASAAPPAVPTFLQVDYRNTPSVGVSRNPSFSWVVPHLPPIDGCNLVSQTNQLQHSFHLQLILAHGTVAETLVHDSGRLLDNRSINIVLGTSAPALLPGTSYTWRLRVWNSADQDDRCGSGWAIVRMPTSLFDGFDASPIWLRSASNDMGASKQPSAAALPTPQGQPSYAYFRSTSTLRAHVGDVASATAFVTANQDGSSEKLLSAYRLYVNGEVVCAVLIGAECD